MLLDEILKSVTGDDGYPGDTATSEHWPGVAPGTRGILNALSPKYCNWAGIVDLDPKPPILWTHGAQDIVVADGSPWEMGTLGSLGAVPGLARRGRVPAAADGHPDPRRARRATSARRAVEIEIFEESGHFPPIDARERWSARVLRLPGVRRELPLPGLRADRARARRPARPRAAGRRADHRLRARGRRAGGPRQAVPRLPAGRPGPRGAAADRQPARARLAGPRAEGLPRAAARPARHGPLDAGHAAARRADYLTHFRADSIVRDAELLREALGVERWSVLGQSFGGCASFTYLSLAPDGLREAFITGGVPAIGAPVDDVYRATWERTIERNRRYYARFPEDRERMLALVARLDAEDVRLPERRPADRAPAAHARQQAGHERRAEALHYVLELPLGSPAFLHDARRPARDRAQPDLRAAARGLLGRRRRHRTGRRSACARPTSTSSPSCFTGEHIFPWMFEDYGALAPRARRADELAAHEWPRLYDADVLRAQHGAGRGGDLHRGPLRRARVLRGDRGADAQPARLGDQRVRPQRAARRRRAHPRPPDRPCPWPRLSCCATGSRELEVEHATLRSELRAFESDYLRQVGVVDVQVQELEARILAIVAARSGAVDDRAAADAAEQRFRETTTAMRVDPGARRAAADRRPQDAVPRRGQAHAPGPVADDAGREHAEAFMKRLNQAYSEGRRGGDRQPRAPVGDVAVRVARRAGGRAPRPALQAAVAARRAAARRGARLRPRAADGAGVRGAAWRAATCSAELRQDAEAALGRGASPRSPTLDA